jgi:hypothetical protein
MKEAKEGGQWWGTEEEEGEAKNRRRGCATKDWDGELTLGEDRRRWREWEGE